MEEGFSELRRAAASAPPEVTFEPPAAPVAPKAAPPRGDALLHTSPMPAQEELSIKLTEGLKGLSTLLSSVDEKLAQQHRASELVAERLQALPHLLEGLVEAERNHLQTLRDLKTSLEEQGRASLQASAEMGKLPELVDRIGSRIERQTDAAGAMRTSVESVGQSVRGLVDVAQRGQNSLITEFRRGQEEQRQRLETLVERQRRTMWVVAALGAVVVICLLIVLNRLPR
jgi:chromosome segregation ATPase